MEIRKLVVLVEETHRELEQRLARAARKAAAVAIIANPFAGRYVDDLEPLMAMGEELGGILGRKCVEALSIDPSQVQSYGKAALVGEDGELEHAAALLHPRMGKTLREAVGGGAALVPSSKKRGAAGQPLDIPLGHKDAAYVRSHFDAMEVRVADAPRAREILVAIAIAEGGRPLPRVGGLKVEDIQGVDGLR